MAEYYGKLKSESESGRGKKFKRAVIVILFILVTATVISVLVGIFGDTARLDETRALVIENGELRRKVSELTEKNEELLLENEELKGILEQNSITAGTTLSKPEGDLGE